MLIKKYIVYVLQIFRLKDIAIKIGKYSYTVYLYQPFGFLFGAIILNLIKINLYNYDLIGSFYFWVINVFTSLIFIKVFGNIEKMKFKIKQ